MKIGKLELAIMTLLTVSSISCNDATKPAAQYKVEPIQKNSQPVSYTYNLDEGISTAHDYYIEANQNWERDRVTSYFAINRAMEILEKTKGGTETRLYSECSLFKKMVEDSGKIPPCRR